MADTPLLELRGITRRFTAGDTEVRALDDVSLTIWPGEFVAIMGPSGSGKSTLMNVIGCLDRPSEGDYRILGRPVGDLSADALAGLRRQTFGFVFQRYNLLPGSSATENVAMPAMYAGLPRPARLANAARLLEQLGMTDRAGHLPSQLSGGQQQRVAIARALINDPPVVLADEPTGALDSRSSEALMGLLGQLHAQGRTIVLITHDPQVAAHAQRIVHIADGRIDAAPTPNRSSTAEPPARHPIDGNTVMPELAEGAKVALRALRTNALRTVLTLLGIIIGVLSVVVMLAVGEGSKRRVLDQITTMGTNLLVVRPGAPGIRGGGDVVTLTPQDAAEIAALPDVALVVPERSARLTVRVGAMDYATTVQGVGADLPALRDWPVVNGSFFTDSDARSYAPVALLGQTVARLLFPGGEDPIGHFVLVRNVPFEVIGVMGEKGNSTWGGDQDDVVFIPLSTGQVRLFGGTYVNAITVKVADIDQVDPAQESIRQLLLARHRTEDFGIRNMASLLDMVGTAQTTLTILLGSVAAISLLVGGIGVMNIMLVSVTERTREIGIRIATGARMRDILLQFNVEAAVVCTVGGIIGLLLGYLIGFGLSLAGIDVVFTLAPGVMAFLSAVGTGLLFGYLPARKAARLDPVIALAAE
ncbi:MacB family efflux pump subunit [Immundisolibacter sp.]|uniref:MacB family efflux pump subunit n=1 Tax=Immundisolibacter sp. TaxID=1934948 RepID=UPI003566E068